MREIKFRAWDKETGKMMTVQYLTLDFKSCQIWDGNNSEPEDDHVFSRDFNDVELMQFTGLYDKNEKEIYEGDIVKRKTVSTGNDKIEIARWVKRTGFEPFQSIPNKFITKDFKVFSVEIIGNIYENPELLN